MAKSDMRTTNGAYENTGREQSADAGLYHILKNQYSDCGIPDEDIRRFAEKLNKYVFAEKRSLNGVLSLVYNFEEQSRDRGAEIGVGRQCVIYDIIINLLDIDGDSARRIYESFSGYHDCQAFSYLMNEYAEWLTKEQREEVLSIAREVFVKEVWEDYV